MHAQLSGHRVHERDQRRVAQLAAADLSTGTFREQRGPPSVVVGRRQQRGLGKTEGLHERRPRSAEVRGLLEQRAHLRRVVRERPGHTPKNQAQ